MIEFQCLSKLANSFIDSYFPNQPWLMAGSLLYRYSTLWVCADYDVEAECSAGNPDTILGKLFQNCKQQIMGPSVPNHAKLTEHVYNQLSSRNFYRFEYFNWYYDEWFIDNSKLFFEETLKPIRHTFDSCCVRVVANYDTPMKFYQTLFTTNGMFGTASKIHFSGICSPKQLSTTEKGDISLLSLPGVLLIREVAFDLKPVRGCLGQLGSAEVIAWLFHKSPFCTSHKRTLMTKDFLLDQPLDEFEKQIIQHFMEDNATQSFYLFVALHFSKNYLPDIHPTKYYYNERYINSKTNEELRLGYTSYFIAEVRQGKGRVRAFERCAHQSTK
ncbi:hypothetical protein DdX_14566 [Ditylenchus destructor]|uniref:Uncharacterized protein n=1 Tax=Ditylenchus destructor TaxID=166010 RepID=A0AAD4QVI2_9BILA|nr:hypothetical protein DdX_14566 [Ditylenchus destructor]